MPPRRIAAVAPNRTVGNYLARAFDSPAHELVVLAGAEAEPERLAALRPAALALYHGLRTPRGELFAAALRREQPELLRLPLLVYAFAPLAAAAQAEYGPAGFLTLPPAAEELRAALAGWLNPPVVILAVDDQKVILVKLNQLLVRNGFTVVTAADGKEAIRKAAEARPQLIVSDIEMPEMNGLEFCARVKGDPATAHIPVVLHSTLSTPADLERGRQAGADDYVVKPADEGILIGKIRSLLAGRR